MGITFQDTYASSFKEDTSGDPIQGTFMVAVEGKSKIIKDIRLAFGGVGSKPVLAKETAAFLHRRYHRLHAY